MQNRKTGVTKGIDREKGIFKMERDFLTAFGIEKDSRITCLRGLGWLRTDEFTQSVGMTPNIRDG
jgi:hypothetical protein